MYIILYIHILFIHPHIRTHKHTYMHVHPHMHYIHTGLFCDGTRQYGVPGNENEECIFCMLVLQYHIINLVVLGPSGTFSRETVRMYKKIPETRIFSQKIGWREIFIW